MSFGLPQKTITQLKSVFKKYPEITQVKVYGSRATNHYRRGSDIDLAFFSESEKDLSSSLSWELDDLPSPYLFDLVNYNTLNESPLKDEIDEYGKVLYKKSDKVYSSLIQEKPQPFLHKLETDDIKPSDTERSFEFRQTEIGKIPKDWKISSISEFGDVVTGTTPKTSNKAYYGNQYKLISPADLDSGLYVTTAHRMLSEEGLTQCRVLPKHSVLVGCIGNVGKVGMTLDEKSATNQQINAIVCNKKADSHFVFYSLFYFKKRLQSKSSQTTVPILNKTNFEKFKILRPPLLEQKKIAAVLFQIHKSIEMQDKLVEITEELKKSMMKQLFIYGVKGQKTKQTKDFLNGKFSIEDDLKQSMVRLGDVSEIVSGQSPKSRYYNENSEGLPFYQGKTEFTEMYIGSPRVWTNKAIKIAKKNDILMSVRAPVGPVNIAIQKSCIGRGLAAIRAKKINPQFLFYYLHSSEDKIKGHGGTVFDSISREQIKLIKIPFPALQEQEEIADILTKIDQKMQIHKKKKVSLEELFKTMLNKLMTGTIRVHQLDLNANLKG